MKIGIDAGHGLNTAGKRSPAGEREWSFNNKVAVACIDQLMKYQDVEIVRLDDPTGVKDIAHKARTDKANKANCRIVVSFHHNAKAGKWGTHGGTETYTYKGSYPNAEKLAKLVHSRILGEYKLTNRGLKKANFHMLRATKMDTILVEGGFMDSTIDIVRLRNDEVLKRAGIAAAEGIADYLGLKMKPVIVKPVEPVKVPPLTDEEIVKLRALIK